MDGGLPAPSPVRGVEGAGTHPTRAQRALAPRGGLAHRSQPRSGTERWHSSAVSPGSRLTTLFYWNRSEAVGLERANHERGL